MKQRPILFSPPMVKAILEGRKTQTRREVKPQPPSDCKDEDPFIDWCDFDPKNNAWTNITINWDEHCVLSPYGKPGDVLYVKETFYAYGYWRKNGLTKTGKQKWKFVDETSKRGLQYFYMNTFDDEVAHRNEIGWHKRPSLFMPKDAARIWLRITNERVEKLTQISGYDCLREGIDDRLPYARTMTEAGIDYRNAEPRFIQKFKHLWESINGADSWDANPWVWVVEFERIENPNK